MKYLWLGFYGLMMLCMGCTTITRPEEGVSQEERREEQVTMTQEQQDLLIRISVDEESVKAGELSEWQKEVLRQYDYAMQYLNKKYPSYTFHLMTCTPKDNWNTYTTFTFYEGTDTETYYSLYLEVEEEGYMAKDNFYGKVIEEVYEEKLLQLLQDEGIPCNKVKAVFSTVYGEEINEQINVDNILDGKICIQQTIQIYSECHHINGYSYPSLVQAIQQVIEDRGIYGSFFIRIYDGLDGDKVVYKENFNQFIR